ncbi:MAG: hypothetical protein ACREO8_06020 [Luteimonas sp.]
MRLLTLHRRSARCEQAAARRARGAAWHPFSGARAKVAAGRMRALFAEADLRV